MDEVLDDDVHQFGEMAKCPVCGNYTEKYPPCRYVNRWLAGELKTWGGRALPEPPDDGNYESCFKLCGYMIRRQRKDS